MTGANVKVNGMSCRSCINKIEGALSSIGVEGKVQFDQGTVEVKYDESKFNLGDIKDVIRRKGYEVAN
ncbi:heavy-metal-associated domain-containing protein [Paenibacillus dokdonensis]|uniref:heavy-metal-associated domain-containing protein n=1 Tax=Paenibacillus dokdonensis TaxID=2567944 RepID=UPI0010A8CA1D|nr:heavy metal-associated domain-containing protein [Paenibacillus dokdonensis]